jgi:hypothetical protein
VGAKPEMTEAQARLALRDVPASVVADYNRCRQSLRKIGCDSVPVARNARWSGKIEFAALKDVVEHHWDGKDAFLVVEKPFEAKLPARTQSDSWGSQIMVAGRAIDVSDVRPWIEVRLDPLGPKYMHERIAATAQLTVEYPEEGGGGFVNTTVGRTRAVSFYVVAPKELVALDRLAPPGSSFPWETVLGVTAAVVAVIVLIRLIRGIWHRVHPTPVPHH